MDMQFNSAGILIVFFVKHFVYTQMFILFFCITMLLSPCTIISQICKCLCGGVLPQSRWVVENSTRITVQMSMQLKPYNCYTFRANVSSLRQRKRERERVSELSGSTSAGSFATAVFSSAAPAPCSCSRVGAQQCAAHTHTFSPAGRPALTFSGYTHTHTPAPTTPRTKQPAAPPTM